MCKFLQGNPCICYQGHFGDPVNFLFQFSASLYQHESNGMFGCIPLCNPGSGYNIGLAHDFLVSMQIAYPVELSIWYLSCSWNVCSHEFHVVGEVYCRYPVAYLYFKASLSLLSSLPCRIGSSTTRPCNWRVHSSSSCARHFVLAIDPSSWTFSTNLLMMPLAGLFMPA